MLIGRKKEIEILNELYNSDQAELIALYGRRRIGKTYLINEVFSDRLVFTHTGLSNEALDKNLLKHQLTNFYNSLIRHGMKTNKKPKTWFDAFLLLELFLQECDNGSRQVIFLDELPWMDTPRSNFLAAFESFWNNWACSKKNIMIIVSGSSTSWITNKLINNNGGLYNRLTYKIKLSPFTLSECEMMYKSLDISFSRYDIVQSYMILGGIPYYLRFMRGKYSLSQNIDNLFFKSDALLKGEYKNLFTSTFTNPEIMMKIIEFLATKSSGYDRDEITSKLKITDGGRLSEYLDALIAGDFIRKYSPFNKNKNYYQLIDPFCIFYLRFVEGMKKEQPSFWTDNLENQRIVSWKGYSFERVCFNHILQIKRSIGIENVVSDISGYHSYDNETNTQIDLIIDRNDNVVNVCEIKFYRDDILINKDLYRKILKRTEDINKLIPKYKTIKNVLITTFGIKKNEYSNIFSNIITLDDLF